MYCFQNVQTLCNFFPFLLSLKVSNQSFKNGSHLPFSEILDDLAKTSLSPPWVVVDRHVGPHVVQGVVGVAVVVVPVVIRVLNRVLRCVGRADRRSVVVCVGECHVGGGIWGKSDFHSHSIAVSCLKETSWGHVIICHRHLPVDLHNNTCLHLLSNWYCVLCILNEANWWITLSQ